MNQIIDRLYARNHVNLNEGFIKDQKQLRAYCGEFEKFLNKKKFYGFDDMGVDNGKIFVEVSGDWKHEHLYFKQLAKEFFEKMKGHEISMGEVVTREDGSDNYSANHYIAIQESVCESNDGDTLSSEEEADDEVSDQEPYNEFINTITTVMGEPLVDRLGHLVNKFSNTPLDKILMSKVEPSSGIDFFLPSKLVVFVLNDGLSTEEENKGIVAVLTLSNSRIHLIDTEVLEPGEQYINTVLYNMHQLELISKEIWIGDVVLK